MYVRASRASTKPSASIEDSFKSIRSLYLNWYWRLIDIITSLENRRSFSWLVRELKKRVPSFKPSGLDVELAVYAQRDLETCLGVKWAEENRYKILMKLESYLSRQPEEAKVFLGFWVDQWLAKWKERVNILHKKPKVSKSCRKCRQKARNMYLKLDHRKELKRMVIRKLINQGEICMTNLIAENMIFSEITRRIQRKGIATQAELNPMEILNSLSSRIARLTEEKGPLIYLRIRLDLA